MAVRIRITRVGRTNNPHYRIGVYDSRTARNGRCLENLGWYNPAGKATEKEYEINVERAKYWISVGAKPTPKMSALLKKVGVFTKK